jgi:hypothetical protein
MRWTHTCYASSLQKHACGISIRIQGPHSSAAGVNLLMPCLCHRLGLWDVLDSVSMDYDEVNHFVHELRQVRNAMHSSSWLPTGMYLSFRQQVVKPASSMQGVQQQ